MKKGTPEYVAAAAVSKEKDVMRFLKALEGVTENPGEPDTADATIVSAIVEATAIAPEAPEPFRRTNTD